MRTGVRAQKNVIARTRLILRLSLERGALEIGAALAALRADAWKPEMLP